MRPTLLRASRDRGYIGPLLRSQHMKHLLNLLAAIALLVWGTHMVRTGVLRVFGANLRDLLAHSMSNRFSAALSGLGVTALVQSSTATSLMTSAFVGQGLISLPAALAVMRGADVGTALMAVLFSTDLSDRKSTRLNSSHQIISYAVFCLKKKKIREAVVLVMNCAAE